MRNLKRLASGDGANRQITRAMLMISTLEGVRLRRWMAC